MSKLKVFAFLIFTLIVGVLLHRSRQPVFIETPPGETPTEAPSSAQSAADSVDSPAIAANAPTEKASERPPTRAPSSPGWPSRINEELRNRPEFRKIVDSTPDEVRDLARDASADHARYAETSALAIEALRGCLAADLCGQRQDPTQPYFPPERTPAHRALNHFLDYVAEARVAGRNEAMSAPTFEELLNVLATIRSPITQRSAIDAILAKGSLSDTEYRSFLAVAPTLLGDARPYAFLKVQSPEFTKADRRSVFVGALEIAFKDDSSAVSLMLDALEKIELLETELRAALKPVCRFKGDPRFEMNWALARARVNAYAKTHAFATPESFTDEMCR